MSEKVDFKKTLDAYQAKDGQFRVVDLPIVQYLMIDGSGDPNTSPAFGEAVQTLYPVAYALKFASKQDLGRDYVVPPLEGLWWAPDMSSFTVARDKSHWDWTLMMMVPDWISATMFESAVDKTAGDAQAARLHDLRMGQLSEGRCVQTLHIGSFDDEADLIARMHNDYIPDHGFALTGKHHEIYLSDSRRVAPHRRRTILRQPVAVTTDSPS